MKSVIVLFLIVLMGTVWAATSDQQDNLYKPADGYTGVYSPDQELEFFDSFEAYIPSTPLTVQTNRWVTWDLTHGGANDPFVSNAQANSGSNSVVIAQDNDLVHDFGAATSGKWKVSFYMYIPTGKAGYFNTLAAFDPPGHTNTAWGLEVYFNLGGAGSVNAGGTGAASFTWTENTWHYVENIVDLDTDMAEFWLDGSLIYSWQWTLGSNGVAIPLSIQANDFYGATADDEMYFDDYAVEELNPSVLFSDNFDGYTPGIHLALQNPVYWTTWSNAPGGSEDALVSNTYFLSDSNSVVITQNNDLVKIFDSAPITSGKWEISFNIFIPTGKAGYFNTMAEFTLPSTFNWGVEVYFNVGGGGEVYGGSSTPVTFSWAENTWQPVTVVVDLNSDYAEFWFNGSLVHSWQWTLGASGGGSPLQIDANDFYGGTADDEMYFDDYIVQEFLVVAPPKLLLSEIVSRPTEAEYVEIYNPGAVEVDLSDYYLGNSTFQGGGDYYYQIVADSGGGGSFADFIARFPDGASIQPGEYQTIACAGDSLFFDAYGVMPTYELYEDSTNTSDVPDMREATPGSINGQGGLTDTDEDVILFNWDGMSDLVWDVDYVIYDNGSGGINEQVDKTGVSMDGPDPGTDPTMYLPDTPIANQVPAPINSTANGYSSHRIDYTEGTQTMSGGNGCTGADETSENLDVTWTDNSAPTPNGPWVSYTQPQIAVSPTSITDSVTVADSMDFAIQIVNTGDDDLNWSASVTITTSKTLRLHIPAASADFTRGSLPNSIGMAPANLKGISSPVAPNSILASGSAWSLEQVNGFIAYFDLATPQVLNNLGTDPTGAGFDNAGDFYFGDQSFFYNLDSNGEFSKVDTTTGGVTILGTIAPPIGESWGGMAADPTTGNLYAVSTSLAASSLSIIDPVAISATLVGATGSPGLISLAVDGTGAMWSHDLVSDEFVSIDKNTGAATTVGTLGFDANFGQGMTWDPVSDQIYMAAFNGTLVQPELRIVDRSTGGSTVVGVLGQTTPGGTNQLGFIAIPGAEAVQPFITLLGPTSGTIAPSSLELMNVRVYGLDVADTTYTADIEIASNDLTDPVVTIPVEIMVKDSVTSISVLDPVPTTYAVNQNYPNPFNPTTTIKYQVPQASQVTIEIFNLLGQKVRTLVKDQVEPGYHEVEWNGLNDVGVKVGSGVYFYKFQAEKFLDIKKMLLLK